MLYFLQYPDRKEKGTNPYNDLRTYIGNDETYSMYEGTMPCVGKPKVLVFVIDFLNDTEEQYPWKTYSVADIERQFFDISMINEPANALFGNNYNSLRDFYYRSSYGKLDITGDVIAYTTQKPMNEYMGSNDFMNEVMEFAGTDDAVDWNKYDANRDGCIDGVYFVLRNDAFPSPDLTGPCNYRRAGKKIEYYAFIQGAGNRSITKIIAHETYHMMGLNDVYANRYVNEDGTGVNFIMEAGHKLGDLCGSMKYIFNWLEPIKIDTKGETNVTLASLSDKPQCAIIYPHGDKNNLNWFFVEYITATNNNFDSDVEPGGGLRIWHITMDPRFLNNYLSPICQPYAYIEAVRPPDIIDYFLYPGDSFTPYTTLNSNYPLSFVRIEESKIMQDLTDSGIYLENIVIENGLAHFTVTIK